MGLRFSKYLLTAGLAGMAAVSLASQSQAPAPSKHQPSVHYVKPGAALSLSHDYDGKTATGALETVQVTLTHPYREGFLSLSVLDNPDLDLLSLTDETQFRLSTDIAVETEIAFRTKRDGTHYLNLQAVYEDGTGDVSRRSFAIRIDAGENRQATKRNTDETAQIPHDGKAVILMPAQEIIRPQ